MSDRATLLLGWVRGAPDWEPLLARIRGRPLPEGSRLEISGEGAERTVVALGKSAHAGVALRTGRNAILALAAAADGLLPPVAADLLAFAREAGASLDGAGLGLPMAPPPWNGPRRTWRW